MQDKIEALEKALQQSAREVKNLAEQNRFLRNENQQLQHSYETLRIQKGGFGFKMLLAAGFGGFFTGALLIYLFFRPQDEHKLLFEQFVHQHQFNIERQISEGDFEKAEKTLREAAELPEFAPVKSEIEFARKITGAARRKCQ